MASRRLAGSLVIAVSLVAAGAEADTVSATRYDLTERAHSVEVVLDRGYATLTVTRTVENVGPKSDQAIFHIELPAGAVATRLRTAGTNAKGAIVWFEGELLEAEEAARRYRELTGVGGYYPKDPALLSWRSQTHLALQVFPVPARSTKVVEYTLRMPLAYEAGRYKLELPRLGTEALAASLRIAPRDARDHVEVNGVEIHPTTPVRAAKPIEVTLEPRGASAVDGELASFGFAADRHLVHSRIAAAPKLSEVPSQASVVVLLDTSRSMTNLESALAATRAYLAEFPRSSVEVLTFDRRVRSPFGGPLPASDALAKLYGFDPPRANGSAIDDALSRADEKLARAAGSVRRILVLTDLRTRAALDPERVAAQTLARGALGHVATVESGEPRLERDDQDPWAALPRKTGGLLWRGAIGHEADGAARSIFSEWVRPKRLEKLVVRGLPSTFTPPAELREGQGIEFAAIASRATRAVLLEGELWSKPVRWTTVATEDEGRRWAGLVFGSELLGELTEKEQMTLAMHGRVVSPVTSYLAIEPGVRPSTEGLDWTTGEGGGGFGEGIGLGSIGAFGYGGGGSGIDRQAFLDRELARILGTCSATSATVAVESTLAEIVDIRDIRAVPPAAASCVGEGLWAIALPAAFTSDHHDWTVAARR